MVGWLDGLLVFGWLVDWMVGQSKAKPWQWERRTVVRLSLESALGRGQGTHGWMVQQHIIVAQAVLLIVSPKA